MSGNSLSCIGPLATERQPEAYDLCAKHVESFTAPRGWQVIRLATSFEPARPSEDDLLALADAVRDASRSSRPKPRPAERAGRPGGIIPFEYIEYEQLIAAIAKALTNSIKVNPPFLW